MLKVAPTLTLHWDGTFPKWAPASLLQHLKTPFCAAGRVKVTFPIFWASIWTLIVFQHHTPLSNRILNRRRTLWMWDMSQAERFSHPPKLATITLPWKSNTIRFEGKKLASLKLNAFTQVVWYIHLLPFIKQCTLSLMFHIIVWSDLPHCVTTVWVYLLTIEDNSAGSISQYSIRRKSKKQSEKNTGWLSIKDSLYLPLMIAVQSPDLQKWMFFIGDVWENFERSAFGDQHHWDWDLHYITLIFSFKGISQHKSCIVLEGLKMYFLLKKYQKMVHNRCARCNLCNLYNTWHF